MTRLCGQPAKNWREWICNDFSRLGHRSLWTGMATAVVMTGGVAVPLIKLLPRNNMHFQAGAALYYAEGNVSQYFYNPNGYNKYPPQTMLYSLLFGSNTRTVITVLGATTVLPPLTRLTYQCGLVFNRCCNQIPKHSRPLQFVLGNILSFSLLLLLLGTVLTVTGQPQAMPVGFSHHTLLALLHIMQSMILLAASPTAAHKITSFVGCCLALGIIGWTLFEAMTGQNDGLNFTEILKAQGINIPANVSGTNQTYVSGEKAIDAFIKTLWLQITEFTKPLVSAPFQISSMLTITGFSAKVSQSKCCLATSNNGTSKKMRIRLKEDRTNDTTGSNDAEDKTAGCWDKFKNWLGC